MIHAPIVEDRGHAPDAFLAERVYELDSKATARGAAHPH